MKSLLKHLSAIAKRCCVQPFGHENSEATLKESAQIAPRPQKAVGSSQVSATSISSRRSSVSLALKLLASLPVLFFLNPTPAKAVLGGGTFGPRFAGDLRGDIVLIGNTLTTCAPSNTSCTSIQNGTTSGNNTNSAVVRVDADGTSNSTPNSSRATLNLPAGSTVVNAYLYYQSAVNNVSNIQPRDTQVRFARTAAGSLPTDTNYQTVTATAIEDFTTSGSAGFTAVVDVTTIVRNAGNGDYWVGDLNGSTNLGSWSGWSLVVVFSNPASPIRNLSVNDGNAIVGFLSTIKNQDVPVSGFQAPNSRGFDVKIGAVAYDGDRTAADSGYKINGISITDAQNSATDAFNSSITDMGNFYPPTWGRNPNYNNSLSVDIDLLNATNFNAIPPNATSATFTIASVDETLYLQAVTTAIELPTISGTLYRDNNRDNSFNTGEPTLPAGITVNLINPSNGAVIATTTTAADGSYNFLRLANGNYIGDGNYIVRANTTDTDIPAGLLLTTPNDLAVTVAGRPVRNINFGFNLVPDLTVTKTHTGNFTQGATGTYTITARNLGGAATTGTVTVSDTLPTGLTPTTATGTGWTCTVSGQTVTCTRADALAANTSYPPITLNVNVAANAPASVTNTATVSGGGQINTTNDSANDPTTITAVSDLTVTKAGTGTFTRGSTGTYTITARNSGQAATTGTVTVSDTLPTGLTPTTATGTGWNCTVSGQTVTCTRADALAANTSYPPITLSVNVAANAPDSVNNTATVAGGGETNTGNNSSTFPTSIGASADLSLTKTANATNVSVGQNVTFTVTASNAGPSPATGVTVTDLLPAGLTFVSATASQGTYNSTTGVWTVGNLANGANATLQITATLTGNNSITNTAQISASGQPDPDSTPGNSIATEDDQASVRIGSTTSQLLLVKRITAITTVTNTGTSNTTNFTNLVDDPGTTDDNSPNWPANYLRGAIDGGAVKPGDEVEYTVYFLSSGGRSVQNAKLCDLVPANTTFLPNAFINGAGIARATGSTAPVNLTNDSADADGGQFIVSGGTLPTGVTCSDLNDNGAVIVNFGNIPNATAPGTPANSYGFIRFRARVE